MIWFIWAMIGSSAALVLFMAWCAVQAWREGEGAGEWVVRLIIAGGLHGMFWMQRSIQLKIDAGWP